MKLPAGVYIREHSFVAKIAAKKLGSDRVAIVFGRTIHLHGVNKEVFLQNRAWVKHELRHVRQYRELGFARFLYQYLVEWIRKGYYHNRFEVEARLAESEEEENLA